MFGQNSIHDLVKLQLALAKRPGKLGRLYQLVGLTHLRLQERNQEISQRLKRLAAGAEGGEGVGGGERGGRGGGGRGEEEDAPVIDTACRTRATKPAKTTEDLPLPEGPITATMG